MKDASPCGRIRNVELALVGGGSTDLSTFCGQKLILVFCRADEASEELAAYAALADQFEDAGAWIVGILEARALPRSSAVPHIEVGIDADGSAFRQLRDLAPARCKPAPDSPATFLIDRDGTVRDAWSGCGHARDALEGARQRP